MGGRQPGVRAGEPPLPPLRAELARADRLIPVGWLGLLPVAIAADVQRPDLLAPLADQIALMGTFP